MKSDQQVLTVSLSSWPLDQSAPVGTPLTGPAEQSASLLDRAASMARPAFKIQPRKEIKIKRMTPFF